MGMDTLMIVVLIALLIGGLPFFAHSRHWGYGPSGIVGALLLIVLLLKALGKL